VTDVEQAYRMFEENDTIALVVARAVYEVSNNRYIEILWWRGNHFSLVLWILQWHFVFVERSNM